MSRLTEKICENIKKYPEFQVLSDGKGAFSFSQFDSCARKIASRLIKNGVGKNDFVTIELPRNKEYIAAMYAAWLTGAAFAPLLTTYPEERLESIRNDCCAKAVINEKFLRSIEKEEPFAGNAEADDDTPALLIYTSGSTGRPKGVLHTHGSISDAVFRYNDYFDFQQGCRTALAAPFSFVVSVHDIFLPLTVCATGCIMPLDVMRDPVLLADFIDENQINHLFISPKMLKVFQPKGNSLKTVYTGSERVSDTYSEDFELVVMYGQSECAGTLAFKVDKKYSNTPIGLPIGEVKAYVLDENGNQVQEGELCLAGRFAREYLNLPEQSAKTFTKNPFCAEDGFENLLRTGDIVKRGEDGNIIFLNRMDWMVKINGQRVEPSEIETVIKSANGVFDAAIKDFKNQYGQVYLVAYYVEKEAVDAQDIKEEISKKLPSYMIPSFFVKLDKLPINANGKLDRNALEVPEAAAFKNDYIAPETDMQKALCHAFEKVLSVENVGVDDDFFALGGDSIKCAMAASECSLYKISTSDIFAGKTPRMIERLLIKKASKKTLVKKAEKPRIYPLTPFERGMYLEQKLDENSTVYNLNVGAVINKTDTKSLKDALCKVFKAHEAFCSYYGEENGLPVRILCDKLPEIEVEKAENREDVISIIDNYAVPFNLNSGIPVRPKIYEISDGSLILHMAIHHIAFDGGSAEEFINELSDALSGKEIQSAELDLSDIYDVQD
ncbi:MAG: non-ribosomal peptide synthetase, partial [Eubacterium sp.]|nr:non-ribosomal peptide synthetase [Eubacterium sp.]